MATPFKIPNLGDSVDSGEVISLFVKEGDVIKKDDPIVELETGKATIEVPSDVAGKIIKIDIKPGDTVKPGQAILTLESSDAAPVAAKPPDLAPVPKEPEPAPVEEKKPAPISLPPPTPTIPMPAREPVVGGNRLPVAAAPSIRKFAREIGVNLAQVTGTGEKGRITVDDVKAHAKSLLTGTGAPALASTGAIRVPPLPDFSKWGAVESQKMNGIRKATAQHMALCWGTIPHVTQQEKADITDLEQMRKRYSRKAEAAGGKLTFTAMLLKIVASALKVYPQFNSSVDLANESLILKKYINIGVAVDTPKGLVVPVVHDVDRKNIIELSVELAGIAEKARTGKMSPADMQGGTFTISNLGGIGGGFFTPIVNHPEVGILGVGRGTQEAVLKGDQFVPRLMLPLSLSYDHRVIDGADGARFLRWIAEAIQEPLLVAMEG